MPSSGNYYPELVPGQPNYTHKTVYYYGVACLPPGATPGSCNVTGGVGAGLEGDYSPYNCPIDTEVLMLVVITGALGCFFVRKRMISSLAA